MGEIFISISPICIVKLVPIIPLYAIALCAYIVCAYRMAHTHNNRLLLFERAQFIGKLSVKNLTSISNAMKQTDTLVHCAHRNSTLVLVVYRVSTVEHSNVHIVCGCALARAFIGWFSLFAWGWRRHTFNNSSYHSNVQLANEPALVICHRIAEKWCARSTNMDRRAHTTFSHNSSPIPWAFIHIPIGWALKVRSAQCLCAAHIYIYLIWSCSTIRV